MFHNNRDAPYTCLFIFHFIVLVNDSRPLIVKESVVYIGTEVVTGGILLALPRDFCSKITNLVQYYHAIIQVYLDANEDFQMYCNCVTYVAVVHREGVVATSLS